MREYLLVIVLAAVPALRNFAGGLLAEWFTVSGRMLSLALHGAAGVVVAVVAVELMPRALESSAPWVVILAFTAGGAFFILMDHVINLVHNRFGNVERSTGP